ncbi:unnamed protein product [Meganyctiphanes norvegica]|uniref:Uncharacterized protein n=1 Tax=Meganyctiphanes norvegica TaxID=48144 RepID=A0AAV2PJ40_MEGNR
MYTSHNETCVSVGEKAGALATVAGLTICTGILLPLFIRKWILSTSRHEVARQKILSGCLCFGAGVLLATVFLHLMPEAQIEIEKAIEDGFMADTDFPVAYVIVCCGFFLVYLVEEVVHHFIPHEHSSPNMFSDMSLDSVKDNNGNDNTAHTSELATGVDNSAFESNNNLIRRKSSFFVDEIEDHRQGGLMKGDSTSVMRAITIIVALSFHSLMEGLAIGLEEHSGDLWLLVGVVCAHKLVVGFSLGMELLQEGLKKTAFLASMITFSLSSPLGGTIGAIIIGTADKETAAGVLIPTVLNALAGGCILFVTFCEVLERERSRPHGHLVRILSLMAGFALMCGLECIPGHSHG